MTEGAYLQNAVRVGFRARIIVRSLSHRRPARVLHSSLRSSIAPGDGTRKRFTEKHEWRWSGCRGAAHVPPHAAMIASICASSSRFERPIGPKRTDRTNHAEYSRLDLATKRAKAIGLPIFVCVPRVEAHRTRVLPKTLLPLAPMPRCLRHRQDPPGRSTRTAAHPDPPQSMQGN